MGLEKTKQLMTPWMMPHCFEGQPEEFVRAVDFAWNELPEDDSNPRDPYLGVIRSVDHLLQHSKTLVDPSRQDGGFAVAVHNMRFNSRIGTLLQV
jgi:hypothetical protein